MGQGGGRFDGAWEESFSVGFVEEESQRGEGVIQSVDFKSGNYPSEAFANKPYKMDALKSLLKEELYPAIEKICID